MPRHKWQEIAERIQRDITDGRLVAGDRLPSERELSARWGVSPMTVHRGLQELQRGGWVVRRPRLGTVVASREARRSRRIAMLYYSDASVLEAKYLSGVRSAIPEEMDLLICVHREEPKREARFLHRLAREVDGVVMIGTGAPENDAVIRDVSEEGLAIVCIDRVSPGLDVDSVVTDNYGATLDALRMLTQRGHTRIAHFTADIMYISSARERYDAYLQACREAGVSDPSRWVRIYPVRDTANRALITRLVSDAVAAMFSRPDPPTAAFCLNEYLLAPLLDACDELGILVPDQLEIVSFNDSLNLMRRHERAVHRLVQRPEAIGRMAVELLLARVNEPTRPPQAVRVPADFFPAELSSLGGPDQPPTYPMPSGGADGVDSVTRRTQQ